MRAVSSRRIEEERYSGLVGFYRGGRDDRGRTLEEILCWDADRLEREHDYIQWLFPLREPSLAQPQSPVLSPADVEILRGDGEIRECMREALRVMRAFYGLEPLGPRPWLIPGNHNYLRLTRILRSLRTCGLEAESLQLFNELEAVYHDSSPRIGSVTFGYWQRAMNEPL